MRPIRIGLFHGAMLGLPEDVNAVEYAVKAEEWGYDSFWVPEVLLSPDMDPLVLLGAAAARTKTLLLGTGVAALPLWSAARLAKAALSVEAISNGRLVLGVGLGFSPEDCEFAQVDWHRRRKIADETLADVRRLTSGASPAETREGGKPNRAMLELVRTKKRRIPVWVGASWRDGYADGALRRTAQYGDCFFPTEPTIGDYRSAQRKIREYAAISDRNSDEIEWACIAMFCLGESKEVAKTMFEAHPFAPHLQSKHAALGTPEDLIEYIEKFVELGVSHFVFMPLCDPKATVEQFRIISESVVRHFRNSA